MFQSGLPFLASMAIRWASSGRHEQRVAEDREAAIHGAAAGLGIRRGLVLVEPEDAAGAGIEGDHVVGRLGQIHDAVDHQRRGLELLQALGLEDPLLFQRS